MERMRRTLANVAAAALLTACADTIEPLPIDFLDPQYEVVVERDSVYATGEVRRPETGQKDLLLDVYRPATLGGPALRPGIVLVHGGGFTVGDKSRHPIPELARRFAEIGYVAVAINYRLTGDDPPTEALSTNPTDSIRVAAAAARVDAALAVQWLRDHASEYRVHPESIAIGGYSAGATTALGVAYWVPGVQHADVDAVLSLSGGLRDSESMIEAGEPPLLLIHGEFDSARPYSKAVADRAAEVGLTYEMHEIPGVDHAGVKDALDQVIGSSTMWSIIRGFLYDHLYLLALQDVATLP